MLKNTLYVLILTIPAFSFLDIMSNGAPASSTGAPGEVSCATIGCHTGQPINSSSGSSSLTISNGAITYTPGETYTITSSVNQNNLTRFGFQLVALADNDSSNAGILSISDASRTQLINGYASLSSRKYITYTFPGTSAISTGLGEWTFEWTAPSVDMGPITFYLATIAGNNDGTDSGDYCYTKSLTLTPFTLGIDVNDVNTAMKIFPNPTNDKITISYVLQKETSVIFKLTDGSGRKLEEWISENQPLGVYDKILTFSKSYPKGIYFLSYKQNGKSHSKKIVLN
jgi:hypothetical protein